MSATEILDELPKLSAEEIQAISDWIKDGAPWPQETNPSWKEQLEKVVNCIL